MCQNIDWTQQIARDTPEKALPHKRRLARSENDQFKDSCKFSYDSNRFWLKTQILCLS
jgi:hypothetical protein